MQTILITGGAGFVGSNLADTLLGKGYKVIAVDNFDDYYSIDIKKKNIAETLCHPHYTFIPADVCDTTYLYGKLPADISAIIHLAAKAGVRSSILSPEDYEQYNTKSIRKALELAVKMNIRKFIFSSSSSVYGNSKHLPFTEEQEELIPLNPYASSKLTSEQIGRDYSEKENIIFISLRLFSVYGPRLRPDLLMTKIAQSILEEKPLLINGKGNSLRDFTYVQDVINGIIRSLEYNDKSYNIFNLGYGRPVSLIEVVQAFEEISGKKIRIEFIDKIKGESEITWADNTKARNMLGFEPKTGIYDGIKNYFSWYCDKS